MVFALLSMCRIKAGDVWEDSGTDVEMGQQLEELILTRAREIRAAGVVESNS